MSIVAILLGLAFFGSFAGRVHPLGDSLAVFRLPIAALFALVVIWSPWVAVLRWSLAVLCIAAMTQIVVLKYVSGPEGPLVVYQKNLQFHNDAVDNLFADINDASPDVIALQEVTGRNLRLLDMLSRDYPYQQQCRITSWASVAVLSRYPKTGNLCIEGQGLAGLLLETPHGPFWAFSVHMHWPWPHSQPRQRDTLIPLLQDLEDPIVLAGDFNMVPWAHTMRLFQKATKTERAGRLERTIVKYRAPLPIDHVLAPGGGSAVLRPQLGSDHFGVLARVFPVPSQTGN